jgi:16S rRNA (cytosine1402-N4)-methyltransferase
MSSNLQLALPGLVVEREVEWVFSEDAAEEIMVESFVHTTVMRDLVAQMLRENAKTESPLFVDATLGGGGHTEALLESSDAVRVIGFDRDPAAREAAATRLARFGDRLRIVAAPFSRLPEELAALGVARVDGLCADLGVSSPQLDDAGRGMSFRREGPIDMRMDPTSGETALELIDRLSDEELADVIFRLGDERRSRRIARSLKRALQENDLHTTLDLRRAIVRAVGPVRVGGVDPATRTFQALRIKVNAELEELETLLAVARDVLAPGAPCAIISFHSLEDRLVKQAFRVREQWNVVTKKPLGPSPEEEEANPRARSAKLRVATLPMAADVDDGDAAPESEEP